MTDEIARIVRSSDSHKKYFGSQSSKCLETGQMPFDLAKDMK